MDPAAHDEKKRAVAADAEAQPAATPTRDAGGDVDIRHGEIRLPTGEVVNASGHRQELERNFVSRRADFIAAGAFYLCVTVSLAELASAIPSSAGVYHWASVTPGRRAGRAVGFFAGYWNALAYALGSASLAAIAGQAVLQMWALAHEGYEMRRWHVFVAYLLVIWSSAAVLAFANSWLPRINNALMVLGYGGWLVSVVAVAALSARSGGGEGEGVGRAARASSAFVWREWRNGTGYKSDGLVFALGMLNGAFNIGSPDCSTHMAEEVPRPSVNIPIAMGVQMTASYLSTIVYFVVLMYSITDFDAVLNTTAAFPLAEIYRQASGGSTAAAIGLTAVVLLPILGSAMGAMMTASRVFWTLARDDAVPFPRTFARVSPRWRNPLSAVLLVAAFCTAMGLLYLASDVAFQAMVGSYAVLVALSYLAAVLPFLLRGRRGVEPGPFFVRGVPGTVISAVSCGFMMVWVVFYCFPYAKPVTAAGMNYSSLIVGGLTVLVGAWWFRVRESYRGPPVLLIGDERAFEVLPFVILIVRQDTDYLHPSNQHERSWAAPPSLKKYIVAIPSSGWLLFIMPPQSVSAGGNGSDLAIWTNRLGTSQPMSKPTPPPFPMGAIIVSLYPCTAGRPS
ncbi:hypothetical protein DL771_005181 [Monosporascus sp. 5C6A]|nr:hypothetical protein DL771_005181 [Monosporascus sp. 5C6A]